jgi:HSP20 family protein
MVWWNPFYEFDAMRREIERVFDEFGFQPEAPFGSAFLPGRMARAYPLVNLSENHEYVYVDAMAPGVDPSSLSINVVHNTLTISGEKRGAPSEVEPEAFHRAERAGGKFVRAVTLPVEIDADKVAAEYSDGILHITLPKAEKAKPKQISVKVA